MNRLRIVRRRAAPLTGGDLAHLTAQVAAIAAHLGMPHTADEGDAGSDLPRLIAVLVQSRKEGHLTQVQVAKRTGTTQSAISDLETGRVIPGFDLLARYSCAVGYNIVISLRPLMTEPAGGPDH